MSEHLYIHIPFCLGKCRYCDFYSATDLSLVPGFLAALKREIQLRGGGLGPGRPVKTVYFGGGTPSILPLDAIGAVLDALARHYPFSGRPEITLEANPGTLTPEGLKGLFRLGINRLSLGIQSFDDKRLSFLGRRHSRSQAIAAIEGARAAGFDNLGLDLIFGLPGESGSDWEKEMDQALAFAPEHLSCYMLTLEPDTPLFRQYTKGAFIPMDKAAQVDRFGVTSEYLERAGFDHYEISNFARAGRHRSRHNSAYWAMASYTGFGPSAHSFRAPEGKDDTAVRQWNTADLASYIHVLEQGRLPQGEKESLTPSQQMLERVMVGLRTREGLDIGAFNRMGNARFERDFKELIFKLDRERLGHISGRRFALTRAGWARLDSILEGFAQDLPA